MPPLPLPTTKQPRPPATRLCRLTTMVSPSCRRRAVDAGLSSLRSAAQRLSSCSAAWRHLHAALRSGCLCGIAWQASSRGIVRCHPHAASRGCCLHVAWRGSVFALPGGHSRAAVVFTCCRMAAVVFALPLLSQRCCLRGRGHCHCLSPRNQGRRGHIPSRAPANNGGAAQGRGIKGQGVNGAMAMPASAQTLFAHEQGAGRKEGGVPWAKRGVSAFNRGRCHGSANRSHGKSNRTVIGRSVM
jgi:hypothetical protein